MAVDSLLIFCYAALSLSVFALFLKLLFRRKLYLPPSPPNKFPVIGHLLLLKPPIHRTFHELSENLGGAPIVSLRLGYRLVFVVSSLQIAEECFTHNDVVLANRPRFLIGEVVSYNCTSMFSASYGDHWRNLRRISAVEIFSSHRLNAFLSVRKDEIRRLIIRLSSSSGGFSAVNMRSLLTDLTFNNIMRMVAGKRYHGEDVDDEIQAKRVRELLADILAVAGAGNPGDYFRGLNRISGFAKRLKKLARMLDAFYQGLVDEKRGVKEKGHTMIDRLVSLQESQPEYYTDEIIKGLIHAMTVAGTDTSAGTLEWALSELLNHPHIMEKARTEIDKVVGSDRLIDESDLQNLPYLQNIVSETLRLHPAAPMMLPHMAAEDCTVAGYDTPRETIILVNVWAIHRDPRIWDDAESFRPERFERDGEIEKLMAFGMGRRACPGAGLARRLVGLTLGSLMQCFDWERVSEETVGMEEGKGVTMPKAAPLEAMCKPRPFVGEVLLSASS